MYEKYAKKIYVNETITSAKDILEVKRPKIVKPI